MRVRAICSDCGRKGNIFILFKKFIISRWAFFTYDGAVAFWECPKCYRRKE